MSDPDGPIDTGLSASELRFDPPDPTAPLCDECGERHYKRGPYINSRIENCPLCYGDPNKDCWGCSTDMNINSSSEN